MCADIKRKKKDPLTSIKNQNWIRKKFGEAGIRVYINIKTNISFNRLMSAAGVTKEQLLEMLQIMEKKDIIEIKGELDIPSEQPKPIIKKEEVEELKKEINREIIEKPKEEIKSEPEYKRQPVRRPPVYPSEEEPKEKVEEIKEIQKEKQEEVKKPQNLRKPREPPKPSIKEKKENSSLTPIEKIISDKYGVSGVKVYKLIDGQRTAEEILKQTGVSEVRLIEILEFLDKQGIIKLEKPTKEKQLKKLSPLTEKQIEGKGITENKSDETGLIPIDIPVKAKLGFSQRLRTGPEITLKFGSKGSKVYDLIDGERNLIDLAIESNMRLKDIDKLMEFLGSKDVTLFKSMDREQIRYKYGNEGFAIYKKYSREGIYIYELIGRVPSFKDIVKETGIEAEKVVEIFIFIHNVLDIELPLTKQMMYKQLGI